MDAEDGELFVKYLAGFIRGHEKALAESPHFPSRPRPSTAQPLRSSNAPAARPATSGSSFALYSTLSIPSLSYSGPATTPASNKQARVFLTPNQLYYLLTRFEELGVDPGPRNIRLENIHAESSSSNYVSFLQDAPPTPKARRGSDQISIQSVSSVRSAVSSMWSSLSASLTGGLESRRAKQKALAREDLRYIYSAFTKIPHLKLAMDHRIRRISGYEEFPFDSAVPLWVFKNICDLEIIDVDYRSFYGWDRLADQLRSLTLKRAGLEDISGLLTNIVLDDMDKRRRRSSKNTASAIGYPSPGTKYAELARSHTSPEATLARSRPLSGDMSRSLDWSRPALISTKTMPRSQRGQESPSSRRRRDSTNVLGISSSSSENSPEGTPRNSTSFLPGYGVLPSSKWQFLRHLCLADNSLTYLTAEAFAPVANTLTSLDLSSNHFIEIPDALSMLVSLRFLNLSHCMIESCRSLSKTPLPAVSVLSLRSNRIASLAGIESLVSLERLDLRDNRLNDPTEMARLTGMPEFKELYVARNPLTHLYDNFRTTIFNLFRATLGYTHDISIDSNGPTLSERRTLVDRPADRIQQEEQSLTKQEVVVVPIHGSKNDVLGKQLTDVNPSSSLTALPPLPTFNAPKVTSKASSGVAGTFPDSVPPPVPPKDEPRPKKMSMAPPLTTSVSDDTGKRVRDVSMPTAPNQELRTPPSMKSGTGLPNLDAPTFSESSDLYRKRMESLKQNFGSDWLNMLGEAPAPGLQPRSISSPVSPEVFGSRALPQLSPAAVVSSGQGLT